MTEVEHPIEQEETFNCSDCNQRFSGEKIRFAKVDDRGIRIVCPSCSEKYTDFLRIR